jgi:hypothetical protein
MVWFRSLDIYLAQGGAGHVKEGAAVLREPTPENYGFKKRVATYLVKARGNRARSLQVGASLT